MIRTVLVLAAIGLTLAAGGGPLGAAEEPRSRPASEQSPPAAQPAQTQSPQAQPSQSRPAEAQPQPRASPPQVAPSPQTQAPRGPVAQLWFDPTQLPAFTGTVERYLPNSRGETDRLVFREGPQVVFPPDMAEGLRQAAPPGRPVTVWGIRARNAPVITMLAYAANPPETLPVMVDRLHWRLARPETPEQATPLAVAGVVKAPYYTPQGEVAGAILEDGTVIILPAGAVPAAEPLRELLRPGARLAAEGTGHAGEGGRAMLVERIGDSAQGLRPVPAAAGPARGTAQAAPHPAPAPGATAPAR